jgi:hypothetical protein
MRYWYRFFCVLLAAQAAGLLACSCVNEAAVHEVLGLAASAPEYTGHNVRSATEAVFSFSKPVKVVGAYFDPSMAADTRVEDNSVVVAFKQKPQAGLAVTADLLVEDEAGNTLNVLAPFRTRNDRIPKLLITEIRTEASKPRGEFVELYCKTAGNMGAVRLYAAGNSIDEPLYEFQPMEVAAGDYILLHMRSYDEVAALDEAGANLALSGPKAGADLTATVIKNIKTDAPEDVRDLWLPSNKEVLRKTDIVYLVDQDKKVIDAAAFRAEADKWEKTAAFAKTMAMLEAQKAWTGEPADSLGSSVTKTINRAEGGANKVSGFYLCKSGNNSPGKANKE